MKADIQFFDKNQDIIPQRKYLRYAREKKMNSYLNDTNSAFSILRNGYRADGPSFTEADCYSGSYAE